MTNSEIPCDDCLSLECCERVRLEEHAELRNSIKHVMVQRDKLWAGIHDMYQEVLRLLRHTDTLQGHRNPSSDYHAYHKVLNKLDGLILSQRNMGMEAPEKEKP